MSLKSKVAYLVARSVIVPLVSTISGKVGEALGDRLAYHVNPPVEEPVADEDPAPTPDEA